MTISWKWLWLFKKTSNLSFRPLRKTRKSNLSIGPICFSKRERSSKSIKLLKEWVLSIFSLNLSFLGNHILKKIIVGKMRLSQSIIQILTVFIFSVKVKFLAMLLWNMRTVKILEIRSFRWSDKCSPKERTFRPVWSMDRFLLSVGIIKNRAVWQSARKWLSIPKWKCTWLRVYSKGQHAIQFATTKINIL